MQLTQYGEFAMKAQGGGGDGGGDGGGGRVCALARPGRGALPAGQLIHGGPPCLLAGAGPTCAA